MIKTVFVDNKVMLPERVKVKFFKGKSGAWIAELPEFDISTESDSLLQLEELMNDLLFVYFDVPEELRKSIRYVRVESEKNVNEETIEKNPSYFKKFISPDAYRAYCNPQ
jgi:hypothetical protein